MTLSGSEGCLTERALVDGRHQHASAGIRKERAEIHALRNRLIALVVDSRHRNVIAGSELWPAGDVSVAISSGSARALLLLLNLDAQRATQARKFPSMDLDRLFDERGVVKLLVAVRERLALEREGGVGIHLLLARMGQHQRCGQQETGKEILERHGCGCDPGFQLVGKKRNREQSGQGEKVGPGQVINHPSSERGVPRLSSWKEQTKRWNMGIE